MDRLIISDATGSIAATECISQLVIGTMMNRDPGVALRTVEVTTVAMVDGGTLSMDAVITI